MAEPLYAGIDLGTARVKVGIFDRLGVAHALRIIPHSDMPRVEGAVTQDAEGWWRAVCQGLRDTIGEVDPSRVAALAV
ncbi:MAG TPA: hypothetical protein VHB98_07490, partial [Chloroflexota bacterium]|nr:hypothetical protein [Chloroflexota bacterium]